jgi:hypothetical protein
MKGVSHANAIEQTSDRNVLQLHNRHVGELPLVGTDMSTDLDAKFNLPAFEVCAFDRQFGEHSLWNRVGPVADFFLVMNMVIAVGDLGSPSR